MEIAKSDSARDVYFYALVATKCDVHLASLSLNVRGKFAPKSTAETASMETQMMLSSAKSARKNCASNAVVRLSSVVGMLAVARCAPRIEHAPAFSDTRKGDSELESNEPKNNKYARVL